jgi:hypothetical protein
MRITDLHAVYKSSSLFVSAFLGYPLRPSGSTQRWVRDPVKVRQRDRQTDRHKTEAELHALLYLTFIEVFSHTCLSLPAIQTPCKACLICLCHSLIVHHLHYLLLTISLNFLGPTFSLCYLLLTSSYFHLPRFLPSLSPLLLHPTHSHLIIFLYRQGV